VSDRHLSILRGVSDDLRKRLRADGPSDHAAHSPGAARREQLKRSSAVADARLAAARARRAALRVGAKLR
jgi:hypothetical protein